MNDPRVKLLARDILQAVLEHWELYKEPVSLSTLCNPYSHRLKRSLGFEVTVGWFVGVMANQGFLTVLRSRAGKKWVMLGDIWKGLSIEEQTRVREWTQLALCPRYEAMRKRRELKHTA